MSLAAPSESEVEGLDALALFVLRFHGRVVSCHPGGLVLQPQDSRQMRSLGFESFVGDRLPWATSAHGNLKVQRLGRCV